MEGGEAYIAKTWSYFIFKNSIFLKHIFVVEIFFHEYMEFTA